MTPPAIRAIVERHIELWINDAPWKPGTPTLNDRVGDAIREAVTLRDKQGKAGNTTLRHELRAARYDARHLRQGLDELHILIDDWGVTGQADGSIQAKINAVCQERDALRAARAAAVAAAHKGQA